MFKKEGIVVGIDGQWAIVQLQSNNPCAHCATTCGVAGFMRGFGHKESKIKITNKIRAQVGDRVIIGIAEYALLKSAMRLYLLPLGSMLGFAISYDILSTITELPHNEPVTLLLGMMGLFLGLGWVRKQNVYGLQENTDCQLVLLKIKN
jgi:sigma-E factor negative regulatory protein RseC